MKINKWIALAAIALLVVAALGAITYTTFALGTGGNDASESQDNGAEVEVDANTGTVLPAEAETGAGSDS